MNIFLSCTKTKENKKCKAMEMYMPSSLFQKSYEYAKTLTSDENDIYILSAKHHLLRLSDIIEPYNETLNDASEEENKKWAEEVISQMKNHRIDFDEKTYFFAGENYIKNIKDNFSNYEEIYAGKGFGEIMHWLDKELGHVDESLIGWLKLYSDNEDINKLME